jgi:RING finger protein 113A
MASTETNVKVPFFKKKGKGRPTTSRKRSASPPPNKMIVEAPSSSKSEVVLPSRKQAANLLSVGTKRTVSQRQDDDNDEEEPLHEGPDVKWTASGSHVNAALEIIAGDEAEALLAKKQKRADSDEEDVPDDGMYRGQKAYQKHLQKNKEVPKAMRVGPQRASGSTIRTVTIVDYQPDVCKDYKGVCWISLIHGTELTRRLWSRNGLLWLRRHM